MHAKKHKRAKILIIIATAIVISTFAVPISLKYFKSLESPRHIRGELPLTLDNAQQAQLGISLEKAFRFVQHGKYERAVGLYEKVLVVLPENPDIYYNLGIAYYGMGRLDDAIRMSKKAIAYKQLDAGIHYNLGVMYGEYGMWEDAVREYRKVIKQDTNHTKAYYNLGLAYGRMGEWQSALNIYERLIRLDPDDMDARYNLALLGIILNDKRIVAKEYKTLQRSAPELAKKIAETIG